ncbi:hypothetical protein GAGA_1851 [Paraglaciecola agarilytica NO2]|nr:hypothetical protein GAGA_1851 [Paraglaciecola agarilytica NO2]
MSVPPVAQRADSTNQLSPELQLIAEITAGLNAQQKIISSKFFY